MVTSLLKYERIKTTDQKAKELRGWADHIITLAKQGDLHARRQALSIVTEKNVVHKVFEEAPKRFAAVSGGYTRVIKLGRRRGDAAMMSLIELVSPETKQPKKKQKATKPAPAKETVAETAVEEAPVEATKEATPAPEAVEAQAEETAAPEDVEAPEAKVDESGENDGASKESQTKPEAADK